MTMMPRSCWRRRYRRDDFEKAATSLSGVDVATNKLIIELYPTLNVAKLESFKGQTPYELHGDGDTTRLKFVNTTGPLPVVSVRVNGGVEVTFFIDTGGSELGLDTDFARELGLPRQGARHVLRGRGGRGRAVAYRAAHPRRLDCSQPARLNRLLDRLRPDRLLEGMCTVLEHPL